MIDFSNKTLSEYITTANLIIWGNASKREKMKFAKDLDYQTILLGCALQYANNDYKGALGFLKGELSMTLNLGDKDILDKEYKEYASYRDNNPEFAETKKRVVKKLQDFVNVLELNEKIKASAAKEQSTYTKYVTENTADQDEVVNKMVSQVIYESRNLADLDDEIETEKTSAENDIIDSKPCPRCGQLLYRRKGVRAYRGYCHDVSVDNMCKAKYLTLKDLEAASAYLNENKITQASENLSAVIDEPAQNEMDAKPETITKDDYSEIRKDEVKEKKEERNKMGFRRLKTTDGSKRIAVTRDDIKEEINEEVIKVKESESAEPVAEAEEIATSNLAFEPAEDDANATQLLVPEVEEEEEVPVNFGVLVSADGSVVEIDLPYFKIGKKNDCQLTLTNANVSRNHAAIITKNDTTYIKDLGSLNGTSINGYKLMPDTETEIKDGQEIMFANLKYTFKKEM